jgi:hypothetical protein
MAQGRLGSAQKANSRPSSALLCSSRFNLALICFLGCVIIYALRSNLSFAIVCMVKPTAIGTDTNGGAVAASANAEEKCPKNSSFFAEHQHSEEEGEAGGVHGEFYWPKTMQGTLLSAFFWGRSCRVLLRPCWALFCPCWA